MTRARSRSWTVVQPSRALAAGVDADGRLGESAMHDTWQVVDDYRARMQEIGIDKPWR